MSNLVGKTLLNRYKVQSFLGRGGMAEVYKVWDNQRMTSLAMKVLLEDLALDRVFIRRFTREAQTLAKLQHPNIVRFYGFKKEDRLAFILMDYIEGETLKHFIHDADGKSMPYGQIRVITRAICGALHYAHGQGLVHCDIKPANIMINQNGIVQLADFGIARMSDAATATMVGAGTPAYMAPEQVRGQDPIPQTDIYALGIVLYEMFTGGERPFTGEQAQTTGGTSERVRWEQLHLPPPSPKKWNPSLTNEIEAVILKCLEKEPEKRYNSAIEVINALELAIGDVPEQDIRPQKVAEKTDTPVGILNKAPAQNNRKKYIQFGVAAALILLMFFALMGGEKSSSETQNTTIIEVVVTQTSQIVEETPVRQPTNPPPTAYIQSTYTPFPTHTAYPTVTDIPPSPMPTNTEKPPEVIRCAGALPTQVYVGMTIRVTTNGKVPKLGIRPDPTLDSHKFTELKSGTEMYVIGGPVCSDTSYFWHVDTPNGRGWVREGNTEFYFIDPLP